MNVIKQLILLKYSFVAVAKHDTRNTLWIHRISECCQHRCFCVLSAALSCEALACGRCILCWHHFPCCRRTKLRLLNRHVCSLHGLHSRQLGSHPDICSCCTRLHATWCEAMLSCITNWTRCFCWLCCATMLLLCYKFYSIWGCTQGHLRFGWLCATSSSPITYVARCAASCSSCISHFSLSMWVTVNNRPNKVWINNNWTIIWLRLYNIFGRSDGGN